jgi:hypothetical protein
MIFLHKRSNVLYRMLFTSFDVASQRQHIVYMNMETGVIFNRDAEKFHKSFVYHSDPQDEIEPNPDQMEMVFEGGDNGCE